jgi:hypothetical protein
LGWISVDMAIRFACATIMPEHVAEVGLSAQHVHHRRAGDADLLADHALAGLQAPRQRMRCCTDRRRRC